MTTALGISFKIYNKQLSNSNLPGRALSLPLLYFYGYNVAIPLPNAPP